MKEKKENQLQIRLSIFFKFIWLGWIGISALSIIAILLYLTIVFTEYDVKIPTLKFTVSNNQYKINGEYLQILRTDEITDQYIGEKMAWDFFNGKQYSRFYKSLYPTYENVLQLFKNDELINMYKQNSSISFISHNIYLEDNFIILKENPQLLIIILILPLSFILFGTLILNNCKNMFYSFPNVFNNLNADRLKYMALFMLIAETLKNLIYYWLNFMLSRKEYFMIDSERIVRFFENSWIDINYSLIFIAIIILLFSFIFKVGVQLKAENDLVI